MKRNANIFYTIDQIPEIESTLFESMKTGNAPTQIFMSKILGINRATISKMKKNKPGLHVDNDGSVPLSKINLFHFSSTQHNRLRDAFLDDNDREYHHRVYKMLLRLSAAAKS